MKGIEENGECKKKSSEIFLYFFAIYVFMYSGIPWDLCLSNAKS